MSRDPSPEKTKEGWIGCSSVLEAMLCFTASGGECASNEPKGRRRVGDSEVLEAAADAEMSLKITKLYEARMAIKLLKEDRVAAKIVDGLYLGSYGGITHVICAAANLELHFPELVQYKQLKVLDNAETDLTAYFEDCFQFINAAHLLGGKVLVHCFAGRSRSATIVIAWLMKHLGFSMEKALRHVKAQRPEVAPNFGFLGQLQRYEKEIAGLPVEVEMLERDGVEGRANGPAEVLVH